MCAPLTPEEHRLQPLEEVSPPWWNLGHTSWFYVRNVLAPFQGKMEPEDEQYDFLLNSYYASLGERLARDRRGAMSRPTTDEIFRYRSSVDDRVINLVQSVEEDKLADLLAVLAIGIQHEQQHQELFYTEIKSIRYQNLFGLRDAYVETNFSDVDEHQEHSPTEFKEFGGGLFDFGNCESGWCWDNEMPVHKYYLEPFALADRLVTNAEYLEFIEDDGYSDPLLWLDNGWRTVTSQGWRAPLYWDFVDGQWWNWTLGGTRPLVMEEPVAHVSFYEADAFVHWKGKTFKSHRDARLPTEREWEHAARASQGDTDASGFLESGLYHPSIAGHHGELRQMAGCLWQWTSSYYEPYPGYQPFPGVLAEYNGKFMDNQRVLRGGSCVTPRDHFRVSYRNFWSAATQFQFTGIRLARTLRN